MTLEFTWVNNDKIEYGIKKFLASKGVSHRMYNDLKHDGSIMLNHHKTKFDAQVEPSDSLTVVFPDEQSDDEVAFSDQPINVVYEDNNWLVINKSAGLTSVPGPANREDTLVNRIKGYLRKNGSHDLKPHLITRLDRFTSGLVLVAKNRLANSLANQRVAKHQIEKYYYAIVEGKLSDEHSIIDQPIGRIGDNFRREVTPDGKNAITEYLVVSSLNDKTLAKIKLHTGRTHQIRVHMTALGHPLLGDQLYDGPLNEGIERQALHAYYLKFHDDLSDVDREFKLDLPADMKAIL
ncbi:RluA family pseudouridine synthase [Apilactobacillus apisilvae]|uniref:Pseudouridine synthase n=1 Tax=Apilactobacillus apisilvae TaxID=2923364 RepID=A0ABY4PIH7_9LACO|nr:RluA family pseudouridine synthase [Apilactobacillus apisilvae]UQS85661.1 RluA family pseudouridine synthase [Apilactobacillus apisilvae]